MKPIVFLVLLSVARSEDEQENELLCKREIIESYNLTGFLSPRPDIFYLCPMMKNSCCSNYDQFKMYDIWHINVLPQMNKHFS